MLSHLYQVLQMRAQRFPTAVALGAADGLGWRTVDSRQLLAQVDGLAVELAASGIQAGDRVVLWSPRGIRTPTYLVALWKLGALAVPFARVMHPDAASATLSP